MTNSAVNLRCSSVLPHCRKAKTFCNDKQCNLFVLFVYFTASQKGKDFLPITNSAVYLRCLSVSSASQKGKDFLQMTNSAGYLRCLSVLPHCRKAKTFCQLQTVQFICAVCLFYRIAERQRLSANDKQCSLFALFVCFTASQKGRDFLPMTNSAIYLRCLSILPHCRKAKTFCQ